MDILDRLGSLDEVLGADVHLVINEAIEVVNELRKLSDRRANEILSLNSIIYNHQAEITRLTALVESYKKR